MNPAQERESPSTRIPAADEGSALPVAATLPPAESADLSAAQLADLADVEKQAEYLRQFWLQQQRRACPECGDW